MASSPASNKKLSVGTVVTAVIHLVMPAVFCMALWVLYKTLHHYHISDILNDLRQIPLRHLMAGGLLTVVNYWVLTTLDASAIRYAGSSLEYGKVALTSFIGYAFSHNVGLSWLSGGSIRYRLYGAWGLTGGEIAKVIAFCQVASGSKRAKNGLPTQSGSRAWRKRGERCRAKLSSNASSMRR